MIKFKTNMLKSLLRKFNEHTTLIKEHITLEKETVTKYNECIRRLKQYTSHPERRDGESTVQVLRSVDRSFIVVSLEEVIRRDGLTLHEMEFLDKVISICATKQIALLAKRE